jgi:hypothetical protein
MNDLIDAIAKHPQLSDEAKQRLIALALVLLSIESQIKERELHQ